MNDVFDKLGEIVKTSDFLAAGMKNYDVSSLCKQGCIERVKNGYYRLSSQNEFKEEYTLAKLLPNAIVCMESALFYYGYSDFTPREWTVAVSRSFSRKVKAVQTELPLKAYYIQNDLLHLGEVTGDFNGVNIPVYDRERTICDCFKYRSKLDNEIFNKALNAYANDKNKNLNNLSVYAKKLRVYKKVTELMEVLLNG